jgi:hypothetical protein
MSDGPPTEHPQKNFGKKKFKAHFFFFNKAPPKKKVHQNLRPQFNKAPINKTIINSKNNSRKKKPTE